MSVPRCILRWLCYALVAITALLLFGLRLRFRTRWAALEPLDSILPIPMPTIAFQRHAVHISVHFNTTESISWGLLSGAHANMTDSKAASLPVDPFMCSKFSDFVHKYPPRGWDEALSNPWEGYGSFPSRCRHTGEAAPDSIFAWSVMQGDGAQFYPDARGLIAAVFVAWAQEMPLLLRPDDLWTFLVQQVSVHINKYPEEFRSLFVSHEGKSKIELTYGFLPPWTTVIDDFQVEILRRTKPESASRMLARFSTTQALDATVQAALLMDVVRAYFEYIVGITCGIPSVNLAGTIADWEHLLTAWGQVSNLLESAPPSVRVTAWTTAVTAVLEKLLETAAVGPDKTWWQSVVRVAGVIPPGGCDGGGEEVLIDGWLSSLVLYESSGKMHDPGRPLSVWDAPSSVAAIPVTLKTDTDTALLILAGTPGYSVLPSGHVAPAPGWAVVRESMLKCSD